jgi:hypothetical protein
VFGIMRFFPYGIMACCCVVASYIDTIFVKNPEVNKIKEKLILALWR